MRIRHSSSSRPRVRLIGGGAKSSKGNAGGGKASLKKRRSRKDKKQKRALAERANSTRQNGSVGSEKKSRPASVFVKAIRKRDRLEAVWIGAAVAERIKVTIRCEDGRTLHVARAAAADGHVELDELDDGARVVEVAGTTKGVLLATGTARVLAKPASS